MPNELFYSGEFDKSICHGLFSFIVTGRQTLLLLQNSLFSMGKNIAALFQWLVWVYNVSQVPFQETLGVNGPT